MDSILAAVESVNSAVNSVVWGPVMLVLLVGTGVYFSLRSGFLQVRRFPFTMRNTVGTLFTKREKQTAKAGHLTPFQALSTALAGTVGVGNIAGVATAITMGGPGAIFWMWVSAFFGMMTKYAEITLAVEYRSKNKQGEAVGGPMFYIEKGLKCKWLAIVFSLLCVLASFGIGNLSQSNTIAKAIESSFGLPPIFTGLIVALIVGLVVIGGIRRIGKVTTFIVPFMALGYIIGAAIVLITNAAQVPHAFSLIFENAFTLQSAAGGVVGYTLMTAMRYGVARGVFSNEAGLGSAPIVHATADVKHPVQQGLWGIFEVFIDTIVVCTLTALVILSTNLWSLTNAAGEALYTGQALSAAAFDSVLPGVGGVFVTIAVFFFAMSTILGWSYYGEKGLEYVFGGGKLVYRLIFIAAIVLGATMDLSLVWDLSDTFNGMMAIPNIIALLLLSPVVLRLTRDYFSKDRLRELK